MEGFCFLPGLQYFSWDYLMTYLNYHQSLDWDFNWIRSVPNNITKMIAGNISINKLKKILKLADIVDVSGSLETNKVKDIIKIKNFLNSLKKLNNEN